MKLSKVSPVFPLALLLGLSACTAAPESEPQPQPAAQELLLATEAAPMYQALAEVYAAHLETQGFQVRILDPVSEPVSQVHNGEADLALSAATEYLKTQLRETSDPSPSPEVDASPSPEPAQDVAPVLNHQQISELVNSLEGEEFSTIELSPGDLGQVLVMSQAGMTLAEVEDFTDVLAACQDLEFVAGAHAQTQLKAALEAADCPAERVSPAGGDDPANLLRDGRTDAVALSRTRALIADEGFIPVPESAAVFDSEPMLVFAAADLAPEAQGVLADLTSTLNDDTLRAVNRMVQGPDPVSGEEVARQWEWLVQ